MKDREDLIKSRAYWLTKIQIDVFNLLSNFMQENNLTQKQVAEQFNVSPSYISQVLNGNFNFTVSKLVELALAVGKVPVIGFESFTDFINKEQYPEHTYRYTIQQNADGASFADISIQSVENVHIPIEFNFSTQTSIGQTNLVTI